MAIPGHKNQASRRGLGDQRAKKNQFSRIIMMMMMTMMGMIRVTVQRRRMMTMMPMELLWSGKTCVPVYSHSVKNHSYKGTILPLSSSQTFSCFKPYIMQCSVMASSA